MDRRITTRELVELAVIAALMIVGKEAMSFIPNVSPVLLFIMVATLTYGWKTLLAVLCFNFVEVLIYGTGIWVLMYFYTWPLAVVAIMICKKYCHMNRFKWSLLALLFGLAFGMLCAIIFIFTSGFKVAFDYWLAGIPYDLIHGASNFVFVFILLEPLEKLLKKMKKSQFE